MKPLQIHQLRSIYDMMSLRGKAALITGGAGGIGRSCAAGLAEAGASIVLMDIPEKKEMLQDNCRAIAGRYQAETMYVTGNVADEDHVNRMIGEAYEGMGRLDIVFANAGVGGNDDNPVQIQLSEWKKVIDINLTGVFLVDRIAANLMKKLGNGGSIINTASMSAILSTKEAGRI